MKKVLILFSVLSLSLPSLTLAQASLYDLTPVIGAKSENGVISVSDVSATFIIGLTRDGGLSFENDVSILDIVEISGVFRVETQHLNQLADIFIVVRVDGASWSMKNLNSDFVSWNGSISQLVPAIESEVLVGELTLELFLGSIIQPGTHSFFIGYLPEGNDVLYFTANATNFYFSGATGEEQAFALFESTISPNIIQPICMECHISTGPASNTSLVYIDSLQDDFNTLQSFVASRVDAVDYILSKASGSTGHGGQEKLPLDSQNYIDMERFLTLLAN